VLTVLLLHTDVTLCRSMNRMPENLNLQMFVKLFSMKLH